MEIIESYSKLRMNLFYTMANHPSKVVVVTSAISAGTIAVETRARIGRNGPIVAALADTESDPEAVIPISKLTWTTPAKINLKRIAIQTASCCSVDKMEDLDRGYPIEFISTFSDADLDDM